MPLTEHDPSCCNGPCAYCDEQDRLKATAKGTKTVYRLNLWVTVDNSLEPDEEPYSGREIEKMVFSALKRGRLEFEFDGEYMDRESQR